MNTQKITSMTLALFLGADVLAGGAHALSAKAEESASQTPVAISQENATLFLPDSYEE